MTDGGIRLQLLNMAERYDQEAEHNERQHQVRAEKPRRMNYYARRFIGERRDCSREHRTPN
jgi:hypothetical protein